jgi:hypothetical protein
MTDDGQPFDPECIKRLMMIPAKLMDSPLSAYDMALPSAQQDKQVSQLLEQAEVQNITYLNEESDKLDRWADESEIAFNAEIKELRKQANELDKQSRSPSLLLQEKVALKRKASHLKGEATKKKAEYFQEQERIQAERMKILDVIESQLALQHTVTELFTINWELL